MRLRSLVRSAGLGVLIGLTIVWLASVVIHLADFFVREPSAKFYTDFLTFGLAHLAAIGAIHFVTLAVMLLSARHRRIRVFISFQHAFEPLACDLEAACAARGFVPLRIPFVEGRAHNETVHDVHERLRQADVLIAIPGPEQSAMDQEVSNAALIDRGIVFLKHGAEHRDVSLCYKGYPVFDIAAMDERTFEPMLRFMALAMNRGESIVDGYLLAIAKGISQSVATFFGWVLRLAPLIIVFSLIYFVVAIVIIVVDWSLLAPLGVIEEVLDKGPLILAVAALLPLSLARTIAAWNAASAVVYRGFQSGELTPEELLEHADAAVGLENDVIAAMVNGKAALAAKAERTG